MRIGRETSHVRRLAAAPVALLTGTLVSLGCGPVGSWRTVEIQPSEAANAIAVATFAKDGTYCVARSAAGQSTTTSGAYRWLGGKLTLTADDATAGTVTGWLRLDGKLTLTETAESGRITTLLERQRDEPPRPSP